MKNKSMFQNLPSIPSCWRSITVILAPIIFAFIFIGSQSKEIRCAYVIIVMAVYWITESLPLPVTSLIPVFAFPLLGILSSGDVCKAYMNETNMMFLGGLMVAIAVEHCHLHRRIALFTVLKMGQSPKQLMAGFMITTMFLSMWISNTASTAMMIPIVDAILQELYKTKLEDNLVEVKTMSTLSGSAEDISVAPRKQSQVDLLDSEAQLSPVTNGGPSLEKDTSKPGSKITLPPNEECKNLKNMYFFSMAYAANIGGTGSLMGTGPNLVVKGVLDNSFTEANDLNFASWMAFNVPGMLICTFLGWIWLQFHFIGFGKWSRMPRTSAEQDLKIKKLIQEKYQELGNMTFHEKSVLFLFILQVILWFFREPGFMVGWGAIFNDLFENKIKVGGSIPAILVVVTLFALPASPDFRIFKKKEENVVNPKGASPRCLNWEVVHEKMPWGIVLLLGGGFALANGATASGLSFWIGGQLQGLAALPVVVSVFIVSIATAMITEVTSNTAVASLLMPVLKDLSLGICVNPLLFMLPAAVCCSYAFMLPVATPPNALVYEAANMKTSQMMKVGLAMNIICVLVINVMINTIGIPMFDIYNVPVWANSTTGEFIPKC